VKYFQVKHSYIHVYVIKHVHICTAKVTHVFFLSLINRAVPPWATPTYIREQAHVLSAQRFHGQFLENFLPNYQRGNGEDNLGHQALVSAEFLIDIFREVWMTIGQTQKIPKGRYKCQVVFNTTN